MPFRCTYILYYHTTVYTKNVRYRTYVAFIMTLLIYYIFMAFYILICKTYFLHKHCNKLNISIYLFLPGSARNVFFKHNRSILLRHLHPHPSQSNLLKLYLSYHDGFFSIEEYFYCPRKWYTGRVNDDLTNRNVDTVFFARKIKISYM